MNNKLHDEHIVERVTHLNSDLLRSWQGGGNKEIGHHLKKFLVIGHGVRTEDDIGLKIVPRREVFIRIENSDGTFEQYSGAPSLFESLANRIIEIAQTARDIGNKEVEYDHG